MDALQRQSIDYADSMKVFADGEPTFIFGAWREWVKECMEAGKVIPPAEFKAKWQKKQQIDAVAP